MAFAMMQNTSLMDIDWKTGCYNLMAEIAQHIGVPNGVSTPQHQNQQAPQSHNQQQQKPGPGPGVVVNVQNQSAVPAQAVEPRRVLIDKAQLEQFLQRHPEVLQAMAQEMQQAATAGQTVPRAIPASQQSLQINQAPVDKPEQSTAPAPIAIQPVQAQQAALQSKIQRLVTIPNKTPPSSPYGIGEMNQASRVDITSLDTQAELYKTDFTIKPVSRAIQGYQQASNAYAHQASIDPIRLEKDTVRKNNPEVLRRLQSAKNIKAALATALTAAHVVEGKDLSQLNVPNIKAFDPTKQRSTQDAQPRRATLSSARALTQPAPQDRALVQRKSDILPFAEQYARTLGYDPEKGETEKILQDTVNFYGKSDTLANTLKTLVNNLAAM